MDYEKLIEQLRSEAATFRPDSFADYVAERRLRPIHAPGRKQAAEKQIVRIGTLAV